MQPRAVPRCDGGRLTLDGCVAVETVHESELVQVVHWRCLCDGDALRSERCHTHHVLAVGFDGSCELRDGRRRVFMDPASAVLHRPGASYRTFHPQGCNDTGVSIAYRADVAEDVFEKARVGRVPCPTITVATRPMRLALQHLVMAIRSQRGLPVDPIAMDELALDMLHDAVARTPGGSVAARSATSDDHRAIVDDAREYLNLHFRDTVRLDDVARAVGASPFHLSRVFHRCAGVSLRAYLHRLRVSAAAHALAGTETNLSRIALDTGFSSHSHLSSTFAREMGVAPSAVRRRLAAAGRARN